MSTRISINIVVDSTNPEALRVIENTEEKLSLSNFKCEEMYVENGNIYVRNPYDDDLFISTVKKVSQKHPSVGIDMYINIASYDYVEWFSTITNGCETVVSRTSCDPESGNVTTCYFNPDGSCQKTLQKYYEIVFGKRTDKTIEFYGDDDNVYDYCSAVNFAAEIYSSDSRVFDRLRSLIDSEYSYSKYYIDEKNHRMYVTKIWETAMSDYIFELAGSFPNALITWNGKYVFDKKVIDEESGVSQSYMVQAFEPEQEIEKKLQFMNEKYNELPLSVCPRCGRAPMHSLGRSRHISIGICLACRTEEAINASTDKHENITEWYAVRFFDDWKHQNGLK